MAIWAGVALAGSDTDAGSGDRWQQTEVEVDALCGLLKRSIQCVNQSRESLGKCLKSVMHCAGAVTP